MDEDQPTTGNTVADLLTTDNMVADLGDQAIQLQFTITLPHDIVTPEDLRALFYSDLIARLGAPPECMPDHGVHVYADHRDTGPCKCAATNTTRPTKGAR